MTPFPVTMLQTLNGYFAVNLRVARLSIFFRKSKSAIYVMRKTKAGPLEHHFRGQRAENVKQPTRNEALESSFSTKLLIKIGRTFIEKSRPKT